MLAFGLNSPLYNISPNDLLHLSATRAKYYFFCLVLAVDDCIDCCEGCLDIVKYAVQTFAKLLWSVDTSLYNTC